MIFVFLCFVGTVFRRFGGVSGCGESVAREQGGLSVPRPPLHPSGQTWSVKFMLMNFFINCLKLML